MKPKGIYKLSILRFHPVARFCKTAFKCDTTVKMKEGLVTWIFNLLNLSFLR